MSIDSALVKRLNRLFSGPLAGRRHPKAQRIKQYFYNAYKFQQTTWNKTLDKFQKNEYRIFSYLNMEALNDRNRRARYREFDMMEFMPELSSALDIYSDEMCSFTDLNPILNIECQDTNQKQILSTLFYDVLDVRNNLWSWVRKTCKYGDFFLYLHLDPQLGVQYHVDLPAEEMLRIEGLDESNPNYVRFKWEARGLTFENFQVAHFRIAANERNFPYGVSVLENSRRIFRQLELLENAIISYRIVRSPERRVFYIDVQNIAPKDTDGYIEKIKTAMRKNQIVDPDTGDVTQRYNALSVEDDLFVPVRGQQSGTKIETLAGGQYQGGVEDVQYLRNKLFAAIKIPSSYLEDKDSPDSQGSLTQKDVRFARTICRLQSFIVAELEKIAQVHLVMLGFAGEKLVNFKLSLNNPSMIWDIQEMEFLSRKLEVAEAAKNFLDSDFIYRKLFNFSTEEIRNIQAGRETDAKFLRKITMLSAPPEAGGGLGGDLGGGLGGGMDMGGGMDLGGDMGGLGELGGGELGGASGPEAGAEGGGGEDTSLLTAPARAQDPRSDGKPLSTFDEARAKIEQNRKKEQPTPHVSGEVHDYEKSSYETELNPGNAQPKSPIEASQVEKAAYIPKEMNRNVFGSTSTPAAKAIPSLNEMRERLVSANKKVISITNQHYLDQESNRDGTDL